MNSHLRPCCCYRNKCDSAAQFSWCLGVVFWSSVFCIKFQNDFFFFFYYNYFAFSFGIPNGLICTNGIKSRIFTSKTKGIKSRILCISKDCFFAIICTDVPPFDKSIFLDDMQLKSPLHKFQLLIIIAILFNV